MHKKAPCPRKSKPLSCDNYGKYGPTLMTISSLHSQINCKTRWNKHHHLTSNLVSALPCEIWMSNCTAFHNSQNMVHIGS